MSGYIELRKQWRQIMNRDGGVWVQILGVEFNIEEIGMDGDKIDMTLIPKASLSKCSLLVTYDEFENLLSSTNQKPMGKVAKIKALLDMLTEKFPTSLTYSINKHAIQPVLVEACIELPEVYQDGTDVTIDELEKAVRLFQVRLGKLNRNRV